MLIPGSNPQAAACRNSEEILTERRKGRPMAVVAPHPYFPFAVRASRILSLPLLGSSDLHYPWQLGGTYSLIEAEPSTEEVIEAIKEGRCRIISSR